MGPKSINELEEMLKEDGHLTDEQIREYIEGFTAALLANINKPQKYFMNNSTNDDGVTEWEKENEQSVTIQGSYFRVQNIMHILANSDLVKLCELKKKYNEKFYEFIYFLYIISEIEELYDDEQQHFEKIGIMFRTKAEFAKRMYEISNEDDEKNKYMYNKLLEFICKSMSEYDFVDVEPELVYNIEDSLVKIINELVDELDKEDVKEDIFIKKFVNSEVFDWLYLDMIRDILNENENKDEE